MPGSGTLDFQTSRTVTYVQLVIEWQTSRTVTYVQLLVDWQTDRVLWPQEWLEFICERTLDIPLGDPTIPNYRPPSRTIPYLHYARIFEVLNAVTVFIPNALSGRINEAVNPKGVISEAVHPGIKITALANPAGKVTEKANPPGKVLNE